MAVTAVVGAQWGDEGKGRIIDWLAQQADMVIRFQGGDNAGHTVINEFGKHALHLIPSGIFNPKTANVVGSGCVVNPGTLLEEMASLEKAGVGLHNLWLSTRAQMLLPWHREMDVLEENRRGKDTIGTTKRGIGPAYADKAARSGLRLGDLLDEEWLSKRLETTLPAVNRKLEVLGGAQVSRDEVLSLCTNYRERLGPRIVDTVPLVRNAIARDEQLLLEGQLGVMRDLDWGIYPYVTSSNPTAAYAPVGAGMPGWAVTRVLGVVKAYSTAVGDGPFPVELLDEEGARLREVGEEFGATTGRPRRCGWFDGVAINYAAWLNGMTGLAVTKLDVLDDFDRLKICVGYRLADGTVVSDTMPDTAALTKVTPVYEEMPGWKVSTASCRAWRDLPAKARAYITRLSKLAGVRVQYVSVGAEREQMFAVG